MITKKIIWVIVLLILTLNVFAIGIRPAQTIFEPEQEEYKGYFRIVNVNQKDMDIKVTITGELANYIYLDQNIIHFNSNDEFKMVNFVLNLPENMAKSEGSFIIEEVSNNQNNFNSKISLKHKVYYNGPVPEKKIETKINIIDDVENIKIISEVINKGNSELKQVMTKITIDEFVKELATNSVNLGFGENKLLFVEVDKSNFKSGEYNLNAATYYDGEIETVSEKIYVGEPEITIKDFNKFFTVGDVNNYQIYLKSNWNKELENCYLEFEIYQNNTLLKRETSNVFSISKSYNFKSYLNTKNLTKGDYQVKINSYHNDLLIGTETFDLKLISDTKLNKASSTIYYYYPNEPSKYYLGLMILTIIILLIMLYYNLKKLKN
jgi:hypothetical protein